MKTKFFLFFNGICVFGLPVSGSFFACCLITLICCRKKKYIATIPGRMAKAWTVEEQCPAEFVC